MKIQRSILFCCCLFVLAGSLSAFAQSKKSKYACTEANPLSLCTAANTCGSPSEPCTVDVKRTANSASVTASTSAKKSNALFCVKTGTQLVWMSSQKNTGFIIDFGPDSPFDPQDTIIGGSNRQITVTAKTPGCYRESVGACVSGTTYGMCGQGNAEVIVTP